MKGKHQVIRRAPRPDASFLRVRNDVLRDPRLSYKALGLLVHMLSHPDNFTFTRETLAGEGEREGVTAVRTGLAELEATGYLVRSRNRNDDGTFTWTQMVYDMPQTTPSAPVGGLSTDDEQLPSSDQWQENGQWATVGGNPSDGFLSLDNAPSIELLLKNDCKEESPSDSPRERAGAQLALVPEQRQPTFDDFYAIYPRRVGKDAARKAWASAVKREAPEVIVSGAERYRDDPNLPEPQFVPHPATWLNGGRWADEPCPPRRVSERPSNDDAIRAALARGAGWRSSREPSALALGS